MREVLLDARPSEKPLHSQTADAKRVTFCHRLKRTVAGKFGGLEAAATSNELAGRNMARDTNPPANENIYRVTRRIKKTEQTIYNALRSIHDDSLFVSEIRHLWRELPLLANLRCGLWYSSDFDGTCYFKSTDGHNGNWSFNTGRMNLHVAMLAGDAGSLSRADWKWSP